MVLPVKGNKYKVPTFLDLQRDLSNYLSESPTRDGHWTVAEKKSQINQGLVAAVVDTMSLGTFIENFDLIGGTGDKPLETISVPPDLIKPMRFIIDTIPYREVTFERYLRFTRLTQGSAVARIDGPQRIFWYDESANVFRLGVGLTIDTLASLYYIRMPKLLEKDDDVSDMNPMFSPMAAMWAASKMLYRDEEHGDRGLKAERDYNKAVSRFETFKNRGAGDRQERIQLDPSQFIADNEIDPGAMDWGDTWDQIP